MAIPTTQLIFSGQRIVHKIHRGVAQVLDITVLSENRKMEIAVKVLPSAELEITLQSTDVPIVPFTTRILWVNIATKEGQNWDTAIDQLAQEHEIEAFVFSSTGGSVPPGFCKFKAMKMELEPIISVAGLNNDMGSLVFGAGMWLDGELDPEGPHQGLTEISMVNEFSIHVWPYDF